jgi:hypothetical protein
MPIEVIVPEAARKIYENWHFAPAVRHDDLIFFSGVVGQGDSAEDGLRRYYRHDHLHGRFTKKRSRHGESEG